MTARAWFGAALALALLGCGSKDADGDGVSDSADCDPDDPEVGLADAWYSDSDEDGFGAGEPETTCSPSGSVSQEGGDCDDADPQIHPEAEERCNALDDNCNGSVDEGLPASLWYSDGDGDGFGLTESGSTSCGGEGLVDTGGDCDDADDSVFPGAEEVCDGIDQDCDGEVDDDPVDGATFYGDADGDGYGRDSEAEIGCEPGTGYALDGGDCKDSDAAVHPGAPELCNGIDDDCDEEIDEDSPDATLWYADVDGDGWGDPDSELAACDPPAGYVDEAGDCDDTDADIHPDTWWYPDADGDGWGLITAGLQQCEQPKGHVLGEGDCDDADPAVNPGALEACNGIDDDCNGLIDDEATDATEYYTDVDEDGYGLSGTGELLCADPGAGYALLDGDCDDVAAEVNPGAIERCDELDNDCDALVDEADPDVLLTDWALDADGDTYGDPTDVVAQCDAIAGRVVNSSDCDDSDPLINPEGTERCNGVDDDCDEEVDEADAVDAMSFYGDGDGDGWGLDADSLVGCSAPSGFVEQGGDCDDGNPSIHPYADEPCGAAVDINCDGSLALEDLDGDGVASCDECDDSEPLAYPGATEVCDEIDNDCNGIVDDGLGLPWYLDGDGDGYGAGAELLTCTPPSGYVELDGDCDDADPSRSPAASEICNGLDDDCDGVVPEEERDLDGDGVSPCEGDPDDTDPTVGSCQLAAASYPETMNFVDAGALESTRMTLAWDGAEIWTSSGGSSTGIRLSRYAADGTWLEDYAPARDVRSVFTLGDGSSPVYLRAYASSTIDVQLSPGVFTADTVLSGGSLDAQSAVVWDPVEESFVAQIDGNLSRWARDGSWIGFTNLVGYGVGSELDYPQERAVAVTDGGCVLTYADGIISVWDVAGNRNDTAELIGAGTSFDSYFSFSYAMGMAWVLDDALGTWRGYDIGL